MSPRFLSVAAALFALTAACGTPADPVEGEGSDDTSVEGGDVGGDDDTAVAEDGGATSSSGADAGTVADASASSSGGSDATVGDTSALDASVGDAAGGDCATNDDCAGDQFCDSGTCAKDVCSQADNVCEGVSKLKACKTDGSGFDEVACASEQACDAGECKKKICEPGVKSCDGNAVITCNSRGVGQGEKTDCAKGESCVGGACLGETCKAGEVKCTEGAAFNCVDGAFVETVCKSSAGSDLGESCVVVGDKATCEPLKCDKGQLFCDGAKLLKCDAEGFTSVELKDCGTGNICSGGQCLPATCNAGNTVCSGNSVATCSADGKSYSVKVCKATETCKDGKCESVACVPTENFCEGTAVHKCNKTGDGSAQLEDCAAAGQGCKDGKCVEKACTPGAKSCDATGGAVLVCAADGFKKVPIPCGNGYVCKAGQCEAVVCNKGDLSCKDNKAYSCNETGTATVELEDCGKDKVCFSGACLSPICETGKTQCSKGGVREVCTNSGLSWAQAPCNPNLVCKTGQCIAKVCEPKVATCNGENLVVCNELGTQEVVQEDCAKAGKTCLAGKCVAKGCKAGATTCNGAELATCKPDGSGWASKACSNGSVCDSGACKQVVCNKDIEFCNQGGHYKCNATGTDKALVEDCEKANKVCQNNKCVAKICSAGEVKCEDGKVKTCHSSGLSWNTTNCAAGTACQAGHCVQKVCSPAAVVCGGNKVQKCNNLGTGGTIVEDCGAKSEFCVSGKCVKAVCQPGARKCVKDKLATCTANGTKFIEVTCDDGDACTVNGCKKDSCVYGETNPCDDSEPCTDDSCDSASGNCAHKAIPGPCDDNTQCTGKGNCEAGKCVLSKGMIVEHVAGSGSYGTNDGATTSARFMYPQGAVVTKTGITYTISSNSHRVRKIVGGQVTTLAGSSAGTVDGKGSKAKFYSPYALDLTANGDIVVADYNSHRLRLVTPDGTVSTLVGSSYGYADGPVKTARLGRPRALTITPDGTVYFVTTYSSSRRIRRLQNSTVTTIAGGSSGNTDGKGTAAQFGYVYGLTHDPAGNLYASDYTYHRIRKIAPDTTVTTIAGSSYGFADAIGTKAQFRNPWNIQYLNKKIYIADYNNYRIRELDLATGAVTTAAGTGSGGYTDGAAATARFNRPRSVALGVGGGLVIADTYNHRIRQLRPPLVTCNDGQVCTTDSCDPATGLCVFKPIAEASQCDDGNACTSGDGCSKAGFCHGTPKICDDSDNCTIDSCDTTTGKCITTPETGTCDDGDECTEGDACIKGQCVGGVGMVSTVAGGASPGFADGSGANVRFYRPRGIDVNANGELVIGDYSNLRVRHMDAQGNVTTLAGTGSYGHTDGNANVARFKYIHDVEWGPNDSVYVADNSNYAIRVIDTKKKVVSTLAGALKYATCADGKGATASIRNPYSLAVNGGAVYTATSCYRIYKILPDGTTTTFTGTGKSTSASYTSDGPKATAQIGEINGMDADQQGYLWLADSSQRTIRRVAPDGAIQTIAGLNSSTVYSKEADGTGKAAGFYNPYDVAVGPTGDVFAVSYYGHRIRRITTGGQVTTIAGHAGAVGSSTTTSGGFQDGVATNAKFNRPQSLTVDSEGKIYVLTYYGTGSTYNSRIRMFQGGAKTCNDNNVCTVDVCDKAAGGCKNTQVKPGTACDDGSLCTKTDECSEIGKCQGEPVSCSDGNVCTDDPCDAATGKCEATVPNNAPCNDGNNCTLNELCDKGACKHGLGQVTTWAGTGSAGFKDGNALVSDFNGIHGLALGPKGDVYIADVSNHRIRRVDVVGKTTTLAGTGTAGFLDGAGNVALLNAPSGVAVDSSDVVVFADRGNHKIRRIDPKQGVVSTVAGTTSGYTDGPGPGARFNTPYDVAVDNHGVTYVADYGNRRVRRILASGFVITHAGSGSSTHKDGPALQAGIDRPIALTIGNSGELFVADASHRIRRISGGTVTTVAGSGAGSYKDEKGVAASFNSPRGMAVDAEGVIYVADYSNHRVRAIAPGGVVTTVAGSTSGFEDGIGAAAKFNAPAGIVIDHLGNLLVGTYDGHRIRKIAALRPPCNDGNPCTKDSCAPDTGKCKFEPTAGGACSDGSECTSNDKCDGKSVCVGQAVQCGGDGNKCVTSECDPGSGSCLTAFVSTACDDGDPCTTGERCAAGQCIGKDGLVNTLAGSESSGYSDGQGPYARFSQLYDVAVDGQGVSYVADRNYQRIRKISADGKVSLYAGTGSAGYTDGPALSARFYYPQAIAAAANGDLLVSSYYHRLRKVDAKTMLVSTVAGSQSSGFVDAKGTDARFNNIYAIALSKTGNAYAVDNGNHAIRIIKPDGAVSTLAGTGAAGFSDGPGNIARFSSPRDIAIDGDGNLFVADYNNRRVRRIDASGTVSTVAGNGNYGSTDGPAANARFGCPWGIAIDKLGSVFIGDYCYRRIRALKGGEVTTIAGNGSNSHIDGFGTAASFRYPRGMTVSATGKILVAGDYSVREISNNAKQCTDNNACTVDSCDEKTGKCVFANVTDDTPCADGSSACTVGSICKAGKCGGGIINTCDDGNVCTIDLCDGDTGACKHVPDSQCVPIRRVFVTTQKYAGSLGGVLGANSRCQSAASSALLGGEWKAWISDSATWPAKDFDAAKVPYQRLDGKVVAKDFTALLSGKLDAGIDLTEKGAKLGDEPTNCGEKGAKVWTNTRADGKRYTTFAAQLCQNWTTSSSSQQYYATVGIAGATDAKWSQGCTYNNCSGLNGAHLYCVEQSDFSVPPKN